MKLPNWLKITWWIVLVIFFSYLTAQRYDSILEGNSTTTDIFIFLIWVALITVPLFRAVNIFGVGFKNEFDNFKNDVREQILNIRSDIHSTVNQKAEINPHFNLFSSPTDSEIKDLESQIKPVLENILENMGIEKKGLKLDIPDDNTYLFKVRFTIENEIRRIWDKLQASFKRSSGWNKPWSEVLEKTKSLYQITRSLEEIGIFSPDYAGAIREVYRICSPAIHGEGISQSSLDFVKETAPNLIASLKKIHVDFGD